MTLIHVDLFFERNRSTLFIGVYLRVSLGLSSMVAPWCTVRRPVRRMFLLMFILSCSSLLLIHALLLFTTLNHTYSALHLFCSPGHRQNRRCFIFNQITFILLNFSQEIRMILIIRNIVKSTLYMQKGEGLQHYLHLSQTTPEGI